jgi:2-C-methyl-D-erythritol 4-phosphate cytidylyltransferase
MRTYAIIVAAGKGIRMGTDIPKQYLLLKGRPVLMHTVSAFHQYDPRMQLIVVLAAGQKEYWNELCRKYRFTVPHFVAEGGETRFHSVKNALSYVPADSLVAVHDGVRPIVNEDLLDALFRVAAKQFGAYPAIPVVDTIRRMTLRGLSKVMDRSTFRLVQTPQVFFSRVLITAYRAEYNEKFTDDVSVVEAQRVGRAVMIEGRTDNIKITTPIDLIMAEALLDHP